MRDIPDARKYQIATVKDHVGEQHLIDKRFAIGHLQSSSKYEHNYEKLKAEHNCTVRSRGPRRKRGPARLHPNTSTQLYMTYSRQTDDDVVLRTQAGFEQLQTGATVAGLTAGHH
ncbi:hypothetical protein MT1_4473 [Pseudomonas sp. MT-1]|uniref:Uncharacterized protein n=1 Tax=Stutzerimonas stutzeri TaxID=316 RepID=A0A172WPM6_STUST|nr:hypothetical protein PS273GM_09180 [Stutzerimonas stutzeri]BAP81646.1 hypothetical protein MT1_4473 [Pseudomonas sp. MT-1]